MLQRIRESLALLLIILLPFHALLVTVLTKVIAGRGHAPLGRLAVWKEGVLAVILCLAVVEIILLVKQRSASSAQRLALDVLDYLIFILIFLSFVLFAYRLPLSASSFIYGFKYDLLPLIAFLILRRVAWSEVFLERIMKMLLIVGGIVAAYGILTLFLPASFFHFLGYSDAHSLYLPDQSLSAFQQISNSALKRIQGPMSGPNQLGIWLLIPIAIAVSSLKPQASRKKSSLALSACSLCLLALGLTFSRSAWIGALAIGVIAYWPKIRPRLFLVFGSCLLLLLLFVAAFPSTLIRLSSSRGHIERPLQALRVMFEHPLGLGLGSAGPAANRTHDPCVILRPQDDPSWAASQPDLCVFLGPTKQVQPPLPSKELRPASQPHARVCNCPLLPENWYLQIGVEMGWAGMGLYVCLIYLLLQRLWRASSLKPQAPTVHSARSLCLVSCVFVLLAISIAALFLHAWEDAAVAYTVWMLLAMRLQVAAKH